MNLVRRNNIEHVIVSTTGEREWQLSDLGIKGKNIELSHDTPLPIRIVYTTPEHLGRDRIAAACGANAYYPGQELPGHQCRYLHDHGCAARIRCLFGR